MSKDQEGGMTAAYIMRYHVACLLCLMLLKNSLSGGDVEGKVESLLVTSQGVMEIAHGKHD